MNTSAIAHLSAIAAAARAIVGNTEATLALASIAPDELATISTHLAYLDAGVDPAQGVPEAESDPGAGDVSDLDSRLPAKLIAQRNACAAALAAAGFTRVEMTYSGCGDEGNLNDILAEPRDLDLSDELHNMLSDFGDAFMDAVASGYEDGEGGGSDLVFDLTERTFYADVYDNEVARTSFIDEAVELQLDDASAAPAEPDLEAAE